MNRKLLCGEMQIFFIPMGTTVNIILYIKGQSCQSAFGARTDTVVTSSSVAISWLFDLSLHRMSLGINVYNVDHLFLV